MTGCTENQGFAYILDLPLKRKAPTERGLLVPSPTDRLFPRRSRFPDLPVN